MSKKPILCPFCGETENIDLEPEPGGGMLCLECGGRGPDSHRPEAIAAWNTRASEPLVWTRGPLPEDGEGWLWLRDQYGEVRDVLRWGLLYWRSLVTGDVVAAIPSKWQYAPVPNWRELEK